MNRRIVFLFPLSVVCATLFAAAGYEIRREAIRPYLLSFCGRTATVSKDLTTRSR